MYEKEKNLSFTFFHFMVIRFVWHFAIKRLREEKRSSKRTKKKKKKNVVLISIHLINTERNIYTQSTFLTFRFIALVHFIYLFKRKSLSSSFFVSNIFNKNKSFFFLSYSFVLLYMSKICVCVCVKTRRRKNTYAHTYTYYYIFLDGTRF